MFIIKHFKLNTSKIAIIKLLALLQYVIATKPVHHFWQSNGKLSKLVVQSVRQQAADLRCAEETLSFGYFLLIKFSLYCMSLYLFPHRLISCLCGRRLERKSNTSHPKQNIPGLGVNAEAFSYRSFSTEVFVHGLMFPHRNVSFQIQVTVKMIVSDELQLEQYRCDCEDQCLKSPERFLTLSSVNNVRCCRRLP